MKSLKFHLRSGIFWYSLDRPPVSNACWLHILNQVFDSGRCPLWGPSRANWTARTKPISSHQRPDSGHPGSAVSGQAAVLARRTRTERARKHTTNSEKVPPIARWQRSIPTNFGIPRRYATRCDRLEVESNCITDLEQTALLNKNPCAWCTPCLSAANA